MSSTDFKDLERTPDKLPSAAETAAANAVQAGLLKRNGDPGIDS